MFTTTEKQGGGETRYYLVTAIAGTVEGQKITSLLAPGSVGQNNDNKIQSPIGQPFTNSGSKVTGIGFLIDNDPTTLASSKGQSQLLLFVMNRNDLGPLSPSEL